MYPSIICRPPRHSSFLLPTVAACTVLISLTAHAQPVIDIDDTNNTVSTDVTWPAGATVNVHRVLTVSATASLTIERGVRVQFDPDTYINAEGGFDVVGTEEQPVLFTSANPQPAAGDWLGIIMWQPPRPPSISHAIVEYTVWGLQFGYTSPVIEHTVIRDVAGYVGVAFQGNYSPPYDVLTIRSCIIERVKGEKGQDGDNGGNGNSGGDGDDSIIPYVNGDNGGNGGPGGSGEHGFSGTYTSGIEVRDGTAFIDHTVIRDITGGVGGTGGRGGRGGRGGHGGDGISAPSSGSRGGDGGDAGGNGTGGLGGPGGNAYGVRLYDRSSLFLSSSLIARITGGRGGEGGPADVGSSPGGNGGAGGNGIGVFADGGDGGNGGNGGSRGRGGTGGPGGLAHGIYIPTSGSVGRFEFNTISGIRRGAEGPGGIVSGVIGSGGTGGAPGTGGSRGTDGTRGSNGAGGGWGADGAIGVPGTSYGLFAFNGDVDLQLTDNIFAYGDTDGGAGISVPGLAPSRHDYNCIFGFQSAFAGTSPSPHELFSDPGFADPFNGNYRLRPDSACIDAASPPVTPGLLDLDGEARPYDVPGVGSDGPGQGFDVGCFEFVPMKEDLNLDGLLNWKDLFALSRDWWLDPAPEGDFDGSGKVDGSDIDIMKRRWIEEVKRP